MQRLWQTLRDLLALWLGLDEFDHWREVAGALGAVLLVLAAMIWREHPAGARALAGVGAALCLLALASWWQSRR